MICSYLEKGRRLVDFSPRKLWFQILTRVIAQSLRGKTEQVRKSEILFLK